MSTLMKICVVVQALLILVACQVFITQATVAPKYRDLYERKNKENIALALRVEHAELAMSLAKGETTRQMTAATAAQAALRARVGALQAAVAALETKSAGDQARQKQVDDNMKVLLAIVEDTNARYETQFQDGIAARNKINSLMTGAIRLEDLLQDARAQMTRGDKVIRVLQEKIVDLEVKLVEKDKTSDGASLASTPLEGTILAVTDGIASINIGSARGVRKGERMVVSRGSQLIGELTIIEVSAQQAAGIVDGRVEAARGDRVYTAQKEGA